MKAVVIGESSDASIEKIKTVYPQHKIIVDNYIGSGDLIGFGPFAEGGYMVIFKSRTVAEQFVKEDPFIQEGLVKSVVIRDWNDTLLPEYISTQYKDSGHE